MFLRSWTYDGDLPSIQCHELIMTPLHDPKDSSSSLFESSLSLAPIAMVFLAPPLVLMFLLYVLLVHLNLHGILK